ncbi:MAG: DinB family protein [Pyrinomonadaceae bacterium]
MAQAMMSKPDASEYAPYYGKYVALVHENDVLEALTNQLHETLELLRGIPEEQSAFRYAPDKWSIKQVVGHMCDTERIFAYRALCFARNEQISLPGYEPDDYVAAANFDERTLHDLTGEFEAIRHATVNLFRHLNNEAWTRRGLASGNEFTVRALAYLTVGHERHHVEALRTRYLI